MKTILVTLFFEYPVEAILILVVFITLLFLMVFKRNGRNLSTNHRIRKLKKRLPDFTIQEIRQRIGYYIWPECQSVDPAQSDEVMHTVAIRNSLRSTMDRMLMEDTGHKHFILLADTGMGKTSFLLNYFAHYLRRWHKPYHMELISVGASVFEDRLKGISGPENTVLLLDAFDADIQAIQEPQRRLQDIMGQTGNFHRVIITCRTHLFPKDKETRENKGIFKATKKASADGESGLTFYKLYLSPMNDEQVHACLKMRFPNREKRRRRKAQEILDNIPDFSLRPLSLTFIDDLIDSGKPFKNAFQIYQAIVNAWLDREEKAVSDRDALSGFLDKLAVVFFLNFEKGIGERISHHEIESLAERFGIKPSDLQLKTDRSLLIRDDRGDYKFAHPSIAKFLFAQRLIDNDEEALQIPMKHWDGHVKTFLLEGLEQRPWRFPVHFVPLKGMSFQMGEKGTDVRIEPFEMALYPVTNREFEEFDPSHREQRNEYSDRDDQPVVNISWEEANEYCEWLSEKMGVNYRLPTEAEWEYAASGGGQRIYPWGNEKPNNDRANYIDSKIMKTKPVRSYLFGMTPDGLYNLAGNVWEWCDDLYDKKKNSRVIRGGSFYDLQDYLRCNVRLGVNQSDRVHYIGFRVVRDIW